MTTSPQIKDSAKASHSSAGTSCAGLIFVLNAGRTHGIFAGDIGETSMAADSFPADQLASDAEWMVMILRGAVIYAKENHDGQGPPSITLGDASKAADIIEAQAKRIKELEPRS